MLLQFAEHARAAQHIGLAGYLSKPVERFDRWRMLPAAPETDLPRKYPSAIPQRILLLCKPYMAEKVRTAYSTYTTKSLVTLTGNRGLTMQLKTLPAMPARA